MNVSTLFQRAVKRFAEKEAVVDDQVRMNYSQLYNRTVRLVNGLYGLGLRKGDRIACLMPNCYQAVEFVMACYKAGFVRIQLGFRLSMDEIFHMIADSEPDAFLIDYQYLQKVEDAIPTLKTVKHVITVSGSTEKYIDYETLIEKSSADEITEVPQLDDLASLNYTSGTTGVLKAAMLSHRNWISAMKQYMLCEGVSHVGDVRVCYVAPITHAAGLGLLPTFLAGGSNILMREFDVKRLLEIIETEKVTNTILVPTIINFIMDHPDIKKYDLSSLRGIYYGASPISPERARQALTVFGPVLFQGYGQTESTGVLSMLDKADHIRAMETDNGHLLGSAGVPSMECEVRIVDEKGNDVYPGEVGEIIVRGDNVMQGYWKNPELTRETVRDGWLFTRDLGRFDDQGYLYLVDRKSDMIISGGFNIYPSEVERALNSHPSVMESMVVGVPDEDWGESVKALVVLKSGNKATEEALILHCKKHLASYKKPKSVEFVSDLPKNFTGKMVRKVVRDKYWVGRDRSIN